MRKNLLCIIILVSFSAFESMAQSWRKSPWEVMLGFGSSTFFGDIGGTAYENNWLGLRDIRLSNNRPSINGGLRYFFSNQLAGRVGLSVSMLSDTDIGSRNEARDLAFTTIIAEPALIGEFFILRYFGFGVPRLNRRGLLKNFATLSAYVFTGLGGVLFFVSPNDKLKQLQGLRGIDHGFFTVSLPLGAGIKVGIANNFDIGLEIGGRYSFSDYLEGYSSPFSKASDIYYLTHLSIIYRIPLR